MVYLIEKEKIVQIEENMVSTEKQEKYWGLFSFEETGKAEKLFGLNKGFIESFLKNPASRFESHDGFDVISFSPLHHNEETLPIKRVCIYIKKNLVLFMTDNLPALKKIVGDIAEDTSRPFWSDRLIYTFFDRATQQDADLLEGIELEISSLEDALITAKKKDCVVDIITLRKKLMRFKRHYEHTLNILEDFQENENELIDSKSMRYLKIFNGRVERLYHIVINLRDYVTQVREAYQAEVDISLNSIMKVFTVITSIFLPLTLIVGWYGMNFKLPEYQWQYGYLFVAVISAAVAIFCLIAFKRRNWFK